MIRFWATVLLAWVCIAPALGQVKDAGPQTRAECERYAHTPLPVEAARMSAPKAWPTCTSYRLYSGIGSSINFQAARQCAWSERLAIQAAISPRYSVGSIFGGSAMLAVLYANGEGVERNIPLAIRFSCESGWAPAEYSGRLERLERIQANKTPEHFGFCDDVTSGFMMGFCTALNAELSNQNRLAGLKRLVASWTHPQQISFAQVQKAEEAYADAHGRGEINIAGTARGMLEIEATQKLRDGFSDAVMGFQKSLPNANDEPSAKAADSELNDLYRKVIAQAEAKKSEYGAVQPSGIRHAERAWLVYRDEWIKFAAMRYPSVPANAWMTILTKDRVNILKDTLCEVDWDKQNCDDEVYEGPHPLL